MGELNLRPLSEIVIDTSSITPGAWPDPILIKKGGDCGKSTGFDVSIQSSFCTEIMGGKMGCLISPGQTVLFFALCKLLLQHLICSRPFQPAAANAPLASSEMSSRFIQNGKSQNIRGGTLTVIGATHPVTQVLSSIVRDWHARSGQIQKRAESRIHLFLLQLDLIFGPWKPPLPPKAAPSTCQGPVAASHYCRAWLHWPDGES